MLKNIEQTPVKRRSKGERTKKLILESAISILAEQGIKGTTHRAVAAHANIQLSLTTYYFKDIQELVQQAFELNSQNVARVTENLWQPILALVAIQSKVALRRVSLRIELQEELTDLLQTMIRLNIDRNRKQLIVEQQLFNESQVSLSLRPLAQKHYETLLKPCKQLCQYFSKDIVNVNAQMLLILIQQTQYRQLLLERATIDSHEMRTLLQQTLAIVLAIKPQ